MSHSTMLLNPKLRSTSIASTVPFEIWNYISLFLPDDQLRKLYSVNRAFFYIALPLRYNTLSLSGPAGFSGSDSGNFAKILDNPSLGKYVHTLIFDLNDFGPSDGVLRLLSRKDPSRNNALEVVGWYFYALSHLTKKKKALEFEAQAQKSKALIISLGQLTDLVLQYRCRPKAPSYKIHADILLLGCSTFGPRLRSLSLHMTAESFLSVFSVEVYFPKLEELVFDIVKPLPPSAPSRKFRKPIPSQLPPTPFINFIRHHLKTLTSLRVISLYSINRNDFYSCIGALPNLQKFSLEEMTNYPELFPPAAFLLLNAATLTEFFWIFDRDTYWMTYSTPPTPVQTPLDVTLPALRKLSLDLAWLRRNTEEIPKVVDFIGRHSGTLTHLNLIGKQCYKEDELHSFLRAIQTSQLQTLEIPLFEVWISTFPALASHLPFLTTLKISFCSVDTDLRVRGRDSLDSDSLLLRPTKARVNDFFYEAMQTPLIHDWHLRTLFFHKRPLNSNLELEFLVAQVVVRSIAHLQFINGIERRHFQRLRCWLQVGGIF